VRLRHGGRRRPRAGWLVALGLALALAFVPGGRARAYDAELGARLGLLHLARAGGGDRAASLAGGLQGGLRLPGPGPTRLGLGLGYLLASSRGEGGNVEVRSLLHQGDLRGELSLPLEPWVADLPLEPYVFAGPLLLAVQTRLRVDEDERSTLAWKLGLRGGLGLAATRGPWRLQAEVALQSRQGQWDLWWGMGAAYGFGAPPPAAARP